MTNKILDKILAHSKKTKALIGIRKYNDGDDFWLGYIIDYNDTIVAMQLVSKFGLDDGLIVEKIENIESVETDNDYIKAFQYLYKNSSKIAKQTVKSIKISDVEKWQYELLKTKFHKGKLVTIELNNGDTITHGYIIDFDEIYLQFKPINNVGEEEGISVYKLSDISSLTVERIESRKRETFYNWKKKA